MATSGTVLCYVAASSVSLTLGADVVEVADATVIVVIVAVFVGAVIVPSSWSR